MAKIPEKWTFGIEYQADNRHADNGQQNTARYLHFSRPMITARPISDITTGKLSKLPNATGKPSSGF